jgi:hypothetical protein
MSSQLPQRAIGYTEPMLWQDAMRLFKSGGIYFWRVGRFGGSFYVKRRKASAVQSVALANERNASRSLA